MTLPARASRITNLVVASVQIPYAMFNAVGESWTYYYGLAVVLEVILLAVILRLRLDLAPPHHIACGHGNQPGHRTAPDAEPGMTPVSEPDHPSLAHSPGRWLPSAQTVPPVSQEGRRA